MRDPNSTLGLEWEMNMGFDALTVWKFISMAAILIVLVLLVAIQLIDSTGMPDLKYTSKWMRVILIPFLIIFAVSVITHFIDILSS
jgi:hypothetical protein